MSAILIAEDERKISHFIEKGLRAAGYLTTTVEDGQKALLLAQTDAFDLMVLDVGLPSLDGFGVLTRLREQGSTMPVVILTARDSVHDRVQGLEGGANDYMVKPFAFGELLARVRLRLRDTPASTSASELDAAGLRLDLRARRVTEVDASGHPLSTPTSLTSREFTLLEMFMRHPEQVLSREQLLGEVWGLGFDPSSNVVDVFVRTLRRKIGPQRIETVRGMGYRLKPLASDVGS